MTYDATWAKLRAEAAGSRQQQHQGRLDAELLQLLVAHRLVTAESVAEAEKEETTREPTVRVLVRKGLLTEDQLLKARAAQLGVTPWHNKKDPPAPDAISRVPGHICRTHLVLPVRLKGKLLSLAMANPENMGAVDAVRSFTGLRVELLLADEAQIAAEIEKVHGAKALRDSFVGLIEQAAKDARASEAKTHRTQLTEADTRPVVGLVNHILTWAIRMGASDVHIEPRSAHVDVRFRVDGQMQRVQEIPSSLLPMLATRLKIMAELDIVETRLPQDGRMSVQLDNRTVDVRMSVLPNHYGPRMVLRILDKSISLKGLLELGFAPKHLSVFKKMLQRPYGMLLVTGPTGSGKTTTLYAAIKELTETARNIMTCEDPVEYDNEGVSQSQVNEKVGLTFAAQLRATLRQDPDVILVGEIRDRETAETAMRAALTGHLVLSTLHCNDSCGAIPRLLDMGVDPYLLSTCLIGVTAQRLVRVLCPRCKSMAFDGDDCRLLAEMLGIEGTPVVLEAKGCPQCFETGYRGRAAVHEILPINEAVAEAIAAQKSIPEIKHMAAHAGYESLQVEALRLVVAGETTLHEAMRSIAFDESPAPSESISGAEGLTA
jgi:type IV pilus assembly protein PilB